MLEGRGFDVHDLGIDVAPEKLIWAVQEHQDHVVCLSALPAVTLPAMKTTIAALENAGLRGKVKVLVGGAPVTQQYAQKIGADGYSEDANPAVTVARRMVAEAHFEKLSTQLGNRAGSVHPAKRGSSIPVMPTLRRNRSPDWTLFSFSSGVMPRVAEVM